MFFYYKEFNILSPLVNFFCIPFFSYVVMPSVMMSILWKKFFFIAVYSVELLLIIIKFFCDYGIYIKYQISGSLCFFICSLIGLLIFVWGENDRKKMCWLGGVIYIVIYSIWLIKVWFVSRNLFLYCDILFVHVDMWSQIIYVVYNRR